MRALASVISRLDAGGSLDRAAAHAAMTAIVDGHAAMDETAQFLTALARRAERSPETADELVGAAEVLRARMVRIEAPPGAIDTCGTGGSGREKLNVSTLAAVVVASLGHPVAKHGNRSSTAIGSSDVLERLGLRPASPARARALLAARGLAFLHAPHHHPALARVAPVRMSLGFRTIFNLLGPLASPASVTRQLVGTSDPRRAPPLASALAALGTERAIVFGGAIDELPIDEPRMAHEVRRGALHTITLDPGAAGVRALVGAMSHRGGTDGFRDALEARSDVAVELVAWNAGVALALARAQSDEPLAPVLARAVADARASLADGEASRFFARYLDAATDHVASEAA